MKQGTVLTAKAAFSFKCGTSRTIRVKVGDVFVITNPKYRHAEIVLIARCRTALINQGYGFTLAQITELFDVARNSA